MLNIKCYINSGEVQNAVFYSRLVRENHDKNELYVLSEKVKQN